MKNSKIIIDSKNFEKEDLSNKNNNFTLINKSSFINCNLKKALFKESQIYDVTFKDCDLQGANFSSSNFKNTQFINCNMKKTVFNSSRFINLNLTQNDCADLKCRGSQFKNSKFKKNQFLNSDLNRTFFENSEFDTVKFVGCKMFMFFCLNVVMKNIYIDRSNLTLAKFINCKKIDSEITPSCKVLCIFEKDVNTRSNFPSSPGLALTPKIVIISPKVKLSIKSACCLHPLIQTCPLSSSTNISESCIFSPLFV